MLPRHFSKDKINKYVRGAAFSRLVEFYTKDTMTLALNHAPLVYCQDTYSFSKVHLHSVIESKLANYLKFVKNLAN